MAQPKYRTPKVVAAPVAHLVGPGKLKLVNGRLVFTTERGPILAMDLRHLQTVFCFGPVGITDDALRQLLLRGVQVAFLSGRGKNCHGHLQPLVQKGSSLRLLQYRVLQVPEARLAIARDVVARKIASQVEAARHLQRHHGPVATPLLNRLRQQRAAVDAAQDHAQLMGIEGTATAVWFELFGCVLGGPWPFRGRNRRPPLDPPNALLSLGYTIVLNRIVARCQAEGLEVTLGALHENRPGRPSLACDLLEPLRVRIVDRWVLRLIGRRVVQPADFYDDPEHGVRLTPEAFPNVLKHWETDWKNHRHGRRLENEIRRFIELLRFHDRQLARCNGG